MESGAYGPKGEKRQLELVSGWIRKKKEGKGESNLITGGRGVARGGGCSTVRKNPTPAQENRETWGGGDYREA